MENLRTTIYIHRALALAARAALVKRGQTMSGFVREALARMCEEDGVDVLAEYYKATKEDSDVTPEDVSNGC